MWLLINEGKSVAIASRITMILNILQPIVLFLTVWFGCRSKQLFSFVAVLMYTVVIASELSVIWNETYTIAPATDCIHLNLHYWNGTRSAVYIVSSLFVFASIPSVIWALVNIFIFISTLLVAVIVYPCGGGSMWCWFIFVAGLILCGFDAWIRALLDDNDASERFLSAQKVTFRDFGRVFTFLKNHS